MTRADLRLGDYRTTCVDVLCDAVITDPPFSAETHEGHNAGERNDGASEEAIIYPPWGREDVFSFVEFWHPRTSGWIVAMTDDILAPVYREAYQSVGRLDFAPVVMFMPGMTVRKQGDGPSSWCIYIMVSRHRSKEAMAWRTTPGGYHVAKESGGGGRGKPQSLLRSLVRDYSNPGQLVWDPCAGRGGTLKAALAMGRCAGGSEMVESVHTEAVAELENVVPLELPGLVRVKQGGLL